MKLPALPQNNGGLAKQPGPKQSFEESEMWGKPETPNWNIINWFYKESPRISDDISIFSHHM